MRQMQPVLWTKGVLLTPQHLQTQDRFLEDTLQFQLGALAFCPWGFHHLEIDHEALAGGSFSIAAARGILPDGLLFDMPVADAPPPPRALEGAWEPDQQTLDIYLAVPEYRYGGQNVSSAQRDRDTRYRAEVLMRRDENTGLMEKPIQVARKNFRLLFEGEALEGNAALRVARVRRSVTGEYQLDSQFVPPVLDLGASGLLREIARRLVEILSAKSSALSGLRRHKNQSLAEFSISDVANFWLLYTINTYFPQIRHLFETRQGHPAELFSAMIGLTGALTTFSQAVHPRDLPTYQHDDLATCFTALDDTLRHLLETVVPANTVSLPLKMVQPTVYATALDQERYLTAPQMYLAMTGDVRQAELWPHVPNLIKISSHDQIELLIRQALPGVQLTYVPNPPAAVPIKTNYHYYQLAKSGRDWEAIVRRGNLAAYVPAEYPNPQLELVILLGR